MTSLAEAAKSGTGQLPLLPIHWDQLDTGSGDESVKITQSFGAISRLDDNRALNKTRDGHSSRVGGLRLPQGNCGARAPRAGLPELQRCRSPSAWKAGLIV